MTKGSGFTTQTSSGVAPRYRTSQQGQLLLRSSASDQGNASPRRKRPAFRRSGRKARDLRSQDACSLHNADGLASARFITSEHWRLHQTCPRTCGRPRNGQRSHPARARAGLSAGTLSPAILSGCMADDEDIIGAYHHYAFSRTTRHGTLDDDVCSSAWPPRWGAAPPLMSPRRTELRRNHRAAMRHVAEGTADTRRT